MPSFPADRPRLLLLMTLLAALLAACADPEMRPTATLDPDFIDRLTGVPGSGNPNFSPLPTITPGATVNPAGSPAIAPTALISFNPLPAPTLGNRTAADIPTPPPLFDTPDPALYDSTPPDSALTDLALRVFGTNLPTRLIVPAINLDATVAPVGWQIGADGAAQWDSPGADAGFAISSVAPGTIGNTVIYGHNNIYGSLFRDLERLVLGDDIYILTAGGVQYHYQVSGFDIILEAGITDEQKARNLAHFNPTPDARLTLLTCWPYTNNTHRVVIVARPVN